MSATCGRIAFSSVGSYATCVSVAASRHTGASRYSKHSSATNAATSAPKPHVSVSSCTTSTRPVLRTDSATMSRSHGAIVRRSMISTLGVVAELLRGLLRAVHRRAPRDDGDAVAAAHVGAAPERQHPVLGRHRVAVVALAVEVLVLEEQHRVLAAERGAQQPRRVARARRERDQEPGDVGEDRLAALAVPDRAALEVAADRDAHDHRARERAVRAPARGRGLRLDLVHRRPHVVEELDLGARAQPAHRLADRAADDVRLRERRVEAAGVAERALQAERDAEHAALARHLVDHVGVGVGDVFAEHADAFVARHLLVQREPDRLAERDDFGVGVGYGLARVVDDRRRPDHVVEHRQRDRAARAASACSAAARTVSLASSRIASASLRRERARIDELLRRAR